MPRLGVDATAVARDGKGHARTQRKLVESLAALGRYDICAYVRTPDAATLLPGIETKVVGAGKTIAWEQIGMRRALRGVDLIVTTADRLPIGAEGRFVVWLFELPTHRIAENRRAGAGAYQRATDLLTTVMWRRSLERAARIVAGSEATARELGLEATVVHPALDDGFGPGAGREGRYVFHLASSDPRDNTATVLTAFARLDADIDLLVGGSLGALEAPLRAAAGNRVTFLGRVSDEELVQLYRGAIAYVDASLYEGFGYQVLEAMACGAPVIASDRSSLPEIVGDAGILCDPTDADAIAAGLRKILDDPAQAATLRALGLERAGAFSWQQTAEGFARVVESVLA